MTLTDMLDLLQPILDRWQLVLLALVLVTLLGNPARNLVGALAPVFLAWAATTADKLAEQLKGSAR